MKYDFWLSLALHFFLVSLFILKSVFITQEKIDYESAIRVDIIGLPDKITKEVEEHVISQEEPLPKPTYPAENIPDKIPEKVPVEESIKLSPTTEKKDPRETVKKKQKEALDKIKKLSAIDKIKSELESAKTNAQIDKAISSLKNSNSDVPKYKGNVLNPGTELSGLNKIQHENYVNLLDRRIKANWSLPQWLNNNDYKALALLKIDQNGNIIQNIIYKSSGNSSYDEIVLDTIKKSEPFPKPPEKFIGILEVKGILVGFPE